eukprot:scaffold274692_cov31-Tisochrysis_lutea.AAC.2
MHAVEEVLAIMVMANALARGRHVTPTNEPRGHLLHGQHLPLLPDLSAWFMRRFATPQETSVNEPRTYQIQCSLSPV